MVAVPCYHRSMRKRRGEDGVPPGTYETRLPLGQGESAVLRSYAELFSRLERKLFAGLRAGAPVTEAKRLNPRHSFNDYH